MRLPSRRCVASVLAVLPALLAPFAATAAARAQAARPPGHWEYVNVGSGVHSNPFPVDGVIAQRLVVMPQGTPWLRVYFASASLGKGSYLRIVSLRDGDVMTMRQEHLEQWNYSTAYFNGDAVLVEIVAGPGTDKNSFQIDKVMAGDIVPHNPAPPSICGATDDRVPAVDLRVGRVSAVGCTAWIIDLPAGGIDKCHLSAGHCAQQDVLEFSVPGSAANCALVFPPATRQFAIDFANSRSAATGAGDDYWVFRCFPNPTSGLTTFQSQGAAFALAAAMPAAPVNVRVTGYGIDGTDSNAAPGGNASSCACTPGALTGTRNQTLQTHTGNVTAFTGNNQIDHQVDSCGGNSGSPILDAGGVALGIHTHGGCNNPAFLNNYGTQITYPALQAAMAVVCAGPPLHGNDECARALAITNGTNGTFNNGSATNSAPPFPCGQNVGKDCWFSYTSTCNGQTTFDTCSANRTLDTVLEVFDACGGSSLGCNDDMGGTCASGSLASRVALLTSPGQRLWIRVGGYGAAVGRFDLNVTSCNYADECQSAYVLQNGVNGPYSSAAATNSATPWPCGVAGSDMWFEFTPMCAGTTSVTFTTCDGASFDTVIQAFSGPCGGLISLGCNDDAGGSCGKRSSLTVLGVPMQRIYVRVGGFLGATGQFLLRVKENQPNDGCAGAVAVVTGVNGPFCNLDADTSLPPWPCGRGGADLWFSHVPSHTGNLVVSTCTATRNFDTVLEVFSGSCGTPVSLGCNDDAGGACAFGSQLSVPVAAGQTYLIRVGGVDATMGNFDVVVGGSATNDHCSSAIGVGLGTNGPFTNVNSTTSAPGWNCGLGACDVWFSFTAGCAGMHTFSTCTATRTFDTVLEVFVGSCAAPTLLACNDDACQTGSRVSVNLGNGAACWIRVGGFAGAAGSFDLKVDTGAGNGNVLQLPHACGGLQIAATGSPNVGGAVTVSLSNVMATPFLGFGFTLPAIPFCASPCTIGPDWLVAMMASSHTLNLPCSAALSGLTLYVQGADFKAGGGCPTPAVALSDTLVITIG